MVKIELLTTPDALDLRLACCTGLYRPTFKPRGHPTDELMLSLTKMGEHERETFAKEVGQGLVTTWVRKPKEDASLVREEIAQLPRGHFSCPPASASQGMRAL